MTPAPRAAEDTRSDASPVNGDGPRDHVEHELLTRLRRLDEESGTAVLLMVRAVERRVEHSGGVTRTGW